LESGQVDKAEELMKRCIDISWDMAKNLINACRANSIDYIVAPYEADAQIAYLLKNKMGHFVITEDSDLLLFGCDYVIVKLDRYGNGVLIRSSKISDCLGPKSHNFNFEKFRQMCILSGCDYLPNLPGVGLQKARHFFGITMIDDITKALKKIPSYLKLKNVKVDQEYIDGFIRSENTFKYQLVFDPTERKLVPLNPYSKEMKNDNLTYAGKCLDPELALQLALGNVDLRTMSIIDDYSPDLSLDSSTTSIWSKNYQAIASNPLDVRFLPTTTVLTKVIENLKRPLKQEERITKKLIIDKELIQSYSKNETKEQISEEIATSSSTSTSNKLVTCTQSHIVRSRHFVQSSFEENNNQSYEELIQAREERLKKINELCSLNSQKSASFKYETDDDLINTSIKVTSLLSSSSSSSLSLSPSSSSSNYFNSSQSSFSPSEELKPKSLALSLNRFAFKKKKFAT